MKNLAALIVFTIIIQTSAFSQACFPNGIQFSTQQEIDNFQTNYPNCTEVGGELLIIDDCEIPEFCINNLNGLNVLTSIGSLVVANTSSLVNLMGLENIITIGADIRIEYNIGLTSLSGLENVTYFGGNITIEGNSSLTNILSLENIDAASIEDIVISNNTLLTTCEAESICNYLANPSGTIRIRWNAFGCNNPLEIASRCGIILPCLPYGNYYLQSQADIDNFQTNYPDCTELEGIISISGDDITNVDGLNQLTSVLGTLKISYNNNLISLSGLSNLNTIAWNFYMETNPNLESLMGLNNLTTIAGDFQINVNNGLTNLIGLENLASIGGLSINGNEQLTNLTGLENIDTISGLLYIGYGNFLSSLVGLDSMLSIGSLRIIGNPLLSTCSEDAICNKINIDPANVHIQSNAPGCNTLNEVEDACLVGVSESNLISEIHLFPNPATNEIYVTGMYSDKCEVTIYNQTGQKVYQRIGSIKRIDLSYLGQGLYVVEFVTKGLIKREKLIIH
jgi:hypothetical protein